MPRPFATKTNERMGTLHVTLPGDMADDLRNIGGGNASAGVRALVEAYRRGKRRVRAVPDINLA